MHYIPSVQFTAFSHTKYTDTKGIQYHHNHTTKEVWGGNHFEWIEMI